MICLPSLESLEAGGGGLSVKDRPSIYDVVLDYVERYGLSEKARDFFVGRGTMAGRTGCPGSAVDERTQPQSYNQASLDSRLFDHW
jgi:hypothetical protein